MKSALIIFAKLPEPGKVKTRLVPLLSDQQAAELYRCMLHDTLENARGLTDLSATYLFHDGEADAERYFSEAAPDMVRYPQQGGDLGERMDQAFRQVFARGHDAVVIIGTDSPHLPLGYLRQSFHDLEKKHVDVVVGPSADGGYYLLAMKRMYPELFRGISWSSSTVLRETLERAEKMELTVSMLPEWHDVDTPEDLARPELRDEGNGAVMTREFLRRQQPTGSGS